MNAPLQTTVGKYHLVRKIATGGMAEVYLAQAAGPAGFQKTLVLKRILPHLAEDQQFVEMFLNEARLAAVLNHPNIVQIFDLGEAAGSYFIAMEFIDGPNLRALCRRAVEKGRVVPFEFAAKILALACEGLHYAHEFCENGQPLNLIHRDISPDNVLISRTGAVKVVDFGIAKAANQGHLTKTGTLKGKLAYMPPEQLRGKPLDRRADVFALGVVLYELLAGMKPFDATSEVAAMQAILHDPPIPLSEHRPDVPAEIVRIITRALEKDREKRYPDCRAMQQDLERFVMQTGTPIGAYELAQLVNELVPPAPVTVQHTPLPKSVPIEIESLEPIELTGRKTSASTAPPLPPPPQQRTPAPPSRTPPPAPQTLAEAVTVPSARGPSRTLVDDAPARGPARGGTSAILAGVAAGGVVVLAGVAYLVFMKPPTPPPMVQPVPDSQPAPVAQPAPVVVPPPTVQAPATPEPAAQPDAPAVVAQPDPGDKPAGDPPTNPDPPATPEPAPAVVEKQPEPEPDPVKPAGNRTPDRRNARGAGKNVVLASARNGQRTPDPVPAVEARPAASTGTLVIETDPPCQISVDGKLLGMSPVTASDIAPGPHDVVIANREKGLQRRMSYSVSSGETRREKVKFGSGTLVFRVRPWANVEIDGKPYGTTPLPAPVTVFEGEHKVRLYNPELNKTLNRTLWIVPDKEEVVKANLEE